MGGNHDFVLVDEVLVNLRFKYFVNFGTKDWTWFYHLYPSID